MILEQKKLIYVYDFNLSKFYIAGGCIPDRIGTGQFGDCYLAFPNSERLRELFYQWKNEKPTLNENN